MYEVRNECGTVISKHGLFSVAKLQADTQAAKAKADGNVHAHYDVFKTTMVYSSDLKKEFEK